MKNASFFLLLVLSFGSATCYAQSTSWDTAVVETAVKHIQKYGRFDGNQTYTLLLPKGHKVYLDGFGASRILSITKLEVTIWVTEPKDFKANAISGDFFGLLPQEEVAKVISQVEQFLQELPTARQKRKGAGKKNREFATE